MKINTLISVTQKGAHRFISLLGSPEAVQKDVYNLYNTGIIQDIPEEFESCEPFKLNSRNAAPVQISASLKTSEYRLAKFAKASALLTIANKGRGGKMKMKVAIENKTKKILAHLKDIFQSEKCPFQAGDAQMFAMPFGRGEKNHHDARN